MPANILVTGAAGYIGGLTVAALAVDERVDALLAYDVKPAQVPDAQARHFLEEGR